MWCNGIIKANELGNLSSNSGQVVAPDKVLSMGQIKLFDI